MKVVTKNIPIYFGYLRIVITKDFGKAFKKLGGTWEKDVNDYDGFVHTDKTKKGVGRYTVFLKPKCSHSIIAHEVVHLVNALFLDTGIQLDPHNDEPQAYLTGWFVGAIYKALKRK